ncbi:hypothetical protein DFH08DRAFT_828394 [Mycena albidolilacea]|uniref:Uncharacterized protein n=1 Tax=Mycena albidolilacea TaxID=1033008 RepID=A0AAD7E677_9AGAR|nr:hypothetical protein DFH08DRAFT_828394 [Mycena albidolilacea]
MSEGRLPALTWNFQVFLRRASGGSSWRVRQQAVFPTDWMACHDGDMPSDGLVSRGRSGGGRWLQGAYRQTREQGDIKLFWVQGYVPSQCKTHKGIAHDERQGRDLLSAQYVAREQARRFAMWGTVHAGFVCCGSGPDGRNRQCNIDFILLATLIGFQLLWLIVSYDITCQYAINFWTQMSGLPERMRLTIPLANIWRWKISHGETIEKNWAFSNGAACSTRLMGPGSRQVTLENVFGFHNYDRLLAMHCVFPKRLAVTMIDGAAHKIMLEAFTKGLEEANPAQVKEWRGLVEAWESKQHSTGAKSPFEAHAEVTTLRDIQLVIAKEELMRTETGDEVERDHSLGTFISMGLEIEEAQRKLTVDVRALKDPTVTQMLGSTKRPMQKQMYDGEGEQGAEATRLFMPLEIKDSCLRSRVCMVGVPDIEAQMREGEVSEVLEDVRGGLRTCTMANRYKLRNYTGQGLLTRGQNILRVISLQIHSAKIWYCYARAALLMLRGHGQWEEHLRVLTDDNVCRLNERALTAEEKAQNECWAEIGEAIINGGIACAAAGTAAAPESSNSMCFEQLRLLREEMRRTIVYEEVAAWEWKCLLAEELPGASPELTEGRILAKADVYLNSDAAAAGTEAVTVEVHLEDELDPEEEARLEGEEED